MDSTATASTESNGSVPTTESTPHEMPPLSELEEMLEALRLAALAYTDDENPRDLRQIALAIGSSDICDDRGWKLTPLLNYMGYTLDRVLLDQSGHVHGYIAHNDDSIVLAYRGTSSAGDLAADIDITSVPFVPQHDLKKKLRCGGIFCCFRGGCRCGRARAHRGFYNEFLCTVTAIDDVIEELLQADPKRIIICGHSMGGALAMGACAYLLKGMSVEQPKKSITLPRIVFVTVGQPRFGNTKFCKQFNKKVRHLQAIGKCVYARITNAGDMIPYLPSSFLDYAHAGTHIYLTKEVGGIVISPSEEDMAHESSFSDHLPEEYFEKFEKVVEIQRQVYTFKGKMGIVCDEEGVVQTVIDNEPAHKDGIRKGDRIVKVDADSYSKEGLARAENGGSNYTVMVRTVEGRPRARPCQQDYGTPSKDVQIELQSNFSADCSHPRKDTE